MFPAIREFYNVCVYYYDLTTPGWSHAVPRTSVHPVACRDLVFMLQECDFVFDRFSAKP